MQQVEWSVQKFAIDNDLTIIIETTFKETLFEFKILNLSSTIGYTGELLTAALMRTADKLQIPYDSFLEENKMLFREGDKNSNFKFSIVQNKLFWKKCSDVTVIYGTVMIVKENNLHSDIILKLMEVNNKQRKIIAKKDETITSMKTKHEFMIKSYNESIMNNEKKEKEMYKKFCVLLNTKKQRIADLENCMETGSTLSKDQGLSSLKRKEIYNSESEIDSQKTDQHESSESQEILKLPQLPKRIRAAGIVASDIKERQKVKKIIEELSEEKPKDYYQDNTQMYFDNM